MSGIIKYLNDKKLIVIFLFIILIPNNGSSNFNGLPFINIFELILIIVVFPILFSIMSFPKNNKYISIVVYALLLVKLILLISPVNGVKIKQYLSKDGLATDNYIQTYNSFWNRKISFLQSKDWNEKRNFPIDWNGKYPNNPFNSSTNFDQLSLIYKINFLIKLTKNSDFILNAEGANLESQIILKPLSLNDNEKLNFEPNQTIFLEKGMYELTGILHFEGKNWTLSPQVKFGDSNKYISALDEKLIFSEKHLFLNDRFNYPNKLIGNIFDYLLLILLLLLFIYFFKIKKQNIKFLFLSIIFFSSFFLLKLVLTKIGFFEKFDSYGSTIISINLIIFLTLFYYFNKNQIYFDSLENNLKKTFFLIFAPTIIYFFLNKNFHEIDLVQIWRMGDDWDAWDAFARLIVVQREWLEAGENVFYFRPGNRYIYAFLRIIFGYSHVIIVISEVWIIIASCYYLAKVSINLGLNKKLSFLASIILMLLFFGENYRWLIGRGLPEFYGLFLILFATYIFTKKELKTRTVIFLAILGAIGTWIREEHGLIIVSLIFFYPYFAKKEKKFDNFLSITTDFIRQNFSKIFLYCSLVTFGCALMFVRNYYLSGTIGLFNHPNMAFDQAGYGKNIIETWTRMFLAIPYLNQLPRMTSVFLVSGLLISIISLFNIKIIKFNVCLPIAIFCILLPYLFLGNWGYNPRYTIHYLPFCIIITAFFVDYFLINKNIKI